MAECAERQAAMAEAEYCYVERQAAAAREEYKQLKKRKRALESEAYGVLGRCFGALPLELIYRILDDLLLSEWRDYLASHTGVRTAPPVSVFSFLCTCSELRGIRNDWCVHAYRMLGGVEDLEDGWAWMQGHFLALVTNTRSTLLITLPLGIVPDRGRLREVCPAMTDELWQMSHANDLHGYHERALDYQLYPNTVKYAAARSRHSVLLYIKSGVWRELDTSEWLAMLRALPVAEMVETLLSNTCQIDTLGVLCAADKTVWAQAVSDLLFPDWGSHWVQDLPAFAAVLAAYQPGWFKCWADVWDCVTTLHGQPKSHPANRRPSKLLLKELLLHAPQELLDMPETADEVGCGRSALVCNNIGRLVTWEGWERLKLSGVYAPRGASPQVWQRIRQQGGDITLSWVIQTAASCRGVLSALREMDGVAADFNVRDLCRISDMGGPRVKVLNALWGQCNGWSRNRRVRVWSHFLDQLSGTNRHAPMRKAVEVFLKTQE